MFKNMKVGTKIASGFGAITILGIIVGISGYLIINNLTHQVNVAEEAYIIKQESLETQRHEKNYSIRKENQDFEYWEAAVRTTKDTVARGLQVTDDADIHGWLKDGLKEFEQYETNGHELNKLILEGKTLDDQMRDAGQAVEHHLQGLEGSGMAMVALLNARREEKNVIIYGDKVLRQGEKSYLQKWQDEMAKINNWSGADAGLKNLTAQYKNLLVQRAQGLKQIEVVNGNLGTAARDVLKNTDHILEKTKKAMHSAENTGKTLIMVILGITVLVAVVLAYIIVRGITKPINIIIEGLSEGAEQVTSASGEVSSASQSLAGGAAEQASAIEETSSSLEEMSSMTKQNADNSQQADNLMKESSQAVVRANESMSELTTSMGEISHASEETSKIIKTIDEIAFQTNLLALNAAVEAARAGEHGAGFAVVAEEVRNLAMRSADAAKSTSVLIEDTVTKVKNGSKLVASVSEVFGTVADSSSKVGELVGEIAAASNEQAQGINQVNIAVTEMDKVTQQSAANAEETASASEELSAQAEQMKDMVGELVALVGDSGGSSKVSSRKYAVGSMGKGAGSAVGSIRKAITPSATKSRALAVPKAKEVKPDDVIPMDDDFKDF